MILKIKLLKYFYRRLRISRCQVHISYVSAACQQHVSCQSAASRLPMSYTYPSTCHTYTLSNSEPGVSAPWVLGGWSGGGEVPDPNDGRRPTFANFPLPLRLRRSIRAVSVTSFSSRLFLTPFVGVASSFVGVTAFSSSASSSTSFSSRPRLLQGHAEVTRRSLKGYSEVTRSAFGGHS